MKVNLGLDRIKPPLENIIFLGTLENIIIILF